MGVTIVVVGEPGSSPRRISLPYWCVRAIVLLPVTLLLGGVVLGWQLRAPTAHAAEPAPAEAPSAPVPDDLRPPPSLPRPAVDDRQWDELSPDLELPVDRSCSGRKVPDREGFEGRVALTFDDGPDLDSTPRILETLRRNGVPAAFFINGERVDDSSRPILDSIAKDPSLILASHGFTHDNMARLAQADVADRIDRNTELLQSVGVEPRFFRFPFGLASCEGVREVRERGMAVTGWHVTSADWCFAERDGYCHPARFRWVPREMRRDMPAFILRQVRRRNGGIVLMHDRIPFTADTLQEVINTLQENGYRFTRLDDRSAFPKLNLAASAR